MHRHFPLRAQGEREAADDSGCRFDAPVTSEKTRTREGHEEPAHRWLDWRAKWSSTETIWHQRIGTIRILVVLIVAWAGWYGIRGDEQTNSGQKVPPTIVTTAPGVVERQPDRSPLRQGLADQRQDKGRTDEEAQRQTEERAREQQKPKEANRIAEMDRQERLKLQREKEGLRRAQEQDQEGAAKEQSASNDVLDTLKWGREESERSY